MVVCTSDKEILHVLQVVQAVNVPALHHKTMLGAAKEARGLRDLKHNIGVKSGV